MSARRATGKTAAVEPDEDATARRPGRDDPLTAVSGRPHQYARRQPRRLRFLLPLLARLFDRRRERGAFVAEPCPNALALRTGHAPLMLRGCWLARLTTPYNCRAVAGVAQSAERNFPKVEVAGSSPVP